MMAPRFVTLALSAALAAGSFSTCRGSAENGGGAAGSPRPVAVAEVELPGVDTSALTPRERREWSSYVSELMAPCADTPVSIAACVKEKRACTRCAPAAKLLLREVREGRTREQAVDSFKARFDSDRVKSIDLADTPVKGGTSAPVTIVEWADFECPACKHVAPILDRMLERYPGKVRVAFKNYPLSIHPRAEPAARAAIAAASQGKFWEMHKKLFEKAPALEIADLEKYGKDVGLDVAKMKADMGSEPVMAKLARDKKQAEAVGLDHTPLVFINGREYKGDYDTELDEWIRLELELAGETVPAPKAPATASVAAPAPSASAGKP
jgi:protein-disulfide isomerase